MSDARPTVLVIDDDADFTELLAALIEGTGCRAAVANNGFCGLRMAREVSPSLILCDFSMPGLDGEKVFKLLQADAAMADVPRVLMSGHGCPDLKIVPADAFIAKPINTHSLRRLLRAFTRSREPVHSPALASFSRS
jgi:CheY-like chemotaxis protein